MIKPITQQIKKGTTLVEVLLYMGLLAIFMFVLIDIFTGSINLDLRSKATSAVQTDSQYILTKLIYDISRAKTISVPANLGDSSANLTFTSNGTSYSYSLSNGKLVLSSGSTNLNLNSLDTTLTSLSFTRLGNVSGKPSIKVSFSIKSVAQVTTANPETRDITSTIIPR